MTEGRPLRFLDSHRYLDGTAMGPLDLLNDTNAVPFTLAAQLVYAPDFVEYRDGVFWVPEVTGMTDSFQLSIDRAFDYFRGDVPRVEAFRNVMVVFDLFASVDVGPYVDDLRGFAVTVGRTWRALLLAEFPDRTFEVHVDEGADEGAYGPQVSFWQRA